MKRKIVLTASRVFPIKHSRHGQPTDFADKILNGSKIHIIRRNLDIWKLNEEKINSGNYYISVCQWSGKPYASSHVEVARINSPISVQPIAISYHSDSDTLSAVIDGKEYSAPDCNAIAQNEGLSLLDFKEWFFGQNPSADKTFYGVIVHFTNLKY